MEQTLTILTLPTPSLKKKSSPVSLDELLDPNMQDFFVALQKSMNAHDGVGIAAPQVGINKQICIVSDQGKNPQILVNPEITWFSKDVISMSEGCLSVPDVWGDVLRPKSIHVKAWNQQGKVIKLKAKGWLSRVIQHEVDHLNGILFIQKADRLEHSNGKHTQL